ncbi:PREDICTED: O-glucosyltransferase rumi homolog [Camelina sativa]|uniref:O-glucosyltransferase rumi homolog n=1 Tax=Camelina sativa TaxID=90675 RepID=A0ABM0WNT6_CAMSA|nr:PREDICTED: O-glucosyltransferase rumi homolog [Camelina sativa]
MGESIHVAPSTGYHHQRQQNQVVGSKLAKTWVTTTIFIFVFFIIFFGASLSWLDMFVLGTESRIQISPISTRNTNKTTIPKIIIKIPLNCTSLNSNTTQTCPSNYPTKLDPAISSSETCPDYFRWIQQDLKVWEGTGITRETLERAKPIAHFRLVIKSGRLYVLKYDKAFQTRDVFTIWGILQLMRMYPGQVPDLELLFLCHDKPGIWKRDFKQEDNATWPPPPLFHYCGHRDAYDIVFPDWSFWGWPEVNLKEWNKLSEAIKEGNKKVKWEDRVPYAYWKGNPMVSISRRNFMKCNFSDKYNPMVRLYVQDWKRESRAGFKGSKLEDQCTHRYKIYIEGNAWSVSEKYILACDSMTLLIKPEFYDFFGRSMIPLKHYWPIRPHHCGDLKFAVEWGNNNTDKAQAIGREGSEYLMKSLEMKYVYDYMLYVLQGYGKLMKLDVTVPENATEVCSETMACPITDGGLIRQCMDDSLIMSPSVKAACDLPQPYGDDEMKSFLEKQETAERETGKWTDEYWEVQNKIFQQ